MQLLSPFASAQCKNPFKIVFNNEIFAPPASFPYGLSSQCFDLNLSNYIFHFLLKRFLAFFDRLNQLLFRLLVHLLCLADRCKDLGILRGNELDQLALKPEYV